MSNVVPLYPNDQDRILNLLLAEIGLTKDSASPAVLHGLRSNAEALVELLDHPETAGIDSIHTALDAKLAALRGSGPAIVQRAVNADSSAAAKTSALALIVGRAAP